MFKTKELLDLKLFGVIRTALNLEWTKGAFGAGIVLDGSIKNFAIHFIVLKVAFSLHVKYIKSECGNGDC